MSCTVRPREAEDVPALVDVLVRVHERDGYPVEGVADPVGWLNHPRAMAHWVAVVDASPIGQITLVEPECGDDAVRLWVDKTGGSIQDLAIIARLFVDPGCRAVGAGRSLMSSALAYSRSIGRSVALDVMEKDQAAIRLYERLGARKIGSVSHRYGDGLMESALVYSDFG